MSAPHEPLLADLTFGFLDRSTSSNRAQQPQLIANVDGNTMLRALKHELHTAVSFTFSVAFVTSSAIALLKQAILDSGASGTIITSDYLGFNSPSVFRELLNLPNTTVRIFNDNQRGFHAKGYLFEQPDTHTAIVGSSNLTHFALIKNNEWNIKFAAMPDGDIVHQIQTALNDQIRNSVLLTSEWITEYESRYVPRHVPVVQSTNDGGNDDLPIGTYDTPFVEDTDPTDTLERGLEAIASGVLPTHNSASDAPATALIVPNAMQRDALTQIQTVRDSGEKRAVVISATGTGKTILTALDVRAFQPERMLFVVHREQILDRAIYEFQRVLSAPQTDFGKLTGGSKDLGRKYVFATIQTLSRPDVLHTIDPESFDYILIDEVHKAGADSYRRVLDYLRPQFLLGVTATPERSDGFNIYELFDFNVPYEIRLQRALEEDMLSPFHYYGVTEYTTDQGQTISDAADLSRLISSERVTHLVQALETYGHAGVPVRGLMFCSRKDEAHELSALLNTRTVHNQSLRTQALTGDDPISVREDVVCALQRGELDYILTVDIFNEGIDIPSVNQVVMLRNTQSSIIFTQQLGRGLRKATGKEYLVVIDFIGNYTNNYLVPIALLGDSSRNKDLIRQKMIQAEEAGAIAGVSSVNFDLVARERVLQSLAKTKLDSLGALKKEVLDLQYRLNRIPTLFDFATQDTLDPVVLASKEGNYWQFLTRTKLESSKPNALEHQTLTYASTEFLNGKRPHELLILDLLIKQGGTSGIDATHRFLEKNGIRTDKATLTSIRRIFDLSFFTEAERKKYGTQPVVRVEHGAYILNEQILAQYRSGELFREHLKDILQTGLHLARHRYSWSTPLKLGMRYSRKDVCRLLNWENNQQSTMYGYKIDRATQTCPIFITYHKSDTITSAVHYEEGFINQSQIAWCSKSKRTLQSAEIQALLSNTNDLHVFVKKDDVEGTDFFYMGKGDIHSPVETTQKNQDGLQVPVVEMTVDLESPVERALYDYFQTATS
jgi:superfamily II DNA or RNA helicase/HKD family nuclease